jgi:hypothetical protein
MIVTGMKTIFKIENELNFSHLRRDDLLNSNKALTDENILLELQNRALADEIKILKNKIRIYEKQLED